MIRNLPAQSFFSISGVAPIYGELVIMRLVKFIFARKHISDYLKAHLSIFIAKYEL